ncbi:GNAT family N-acetyltransferase [Legionella sp. PATHC035]|uniref:GNAT family N-acetyltransferase n=1 Tax=Legionella sp. PATHC035 TaxID=2992040 RepID=UPI002244B460|nr:GNAT family N-acetyltransferase [Legionella sp. PATHC035]MCW8408896.1 GNAT family N-acetyltransferase [Legionella sp. PATHC035]
MKITLNNKEYTFLIGYQKEDNYRAQLNNLAKKTFGISFEDWYQAGYWNEKYIPYTLFYGDRAVANVSVNIMNFQVLGHQQRYIQIGTVMTDEAYKNKGLSRFLMEHVLSEWNQKCNFIYLYANPSALELYPKFGFVKVKEYSFFKRVENPIKRANFSKLDMQVQSNRDKLYDYAKNNQGFGALFMKENADLVMFSCVQFLKDNVYYIQELDVIVVAKFNHNQLHLLDIFGKTQVGLDEIIHSLCDSSINEVLFGFTPKDCTSYEIKENIGDDVLFIQQDKDRIFVENKVMFPVLSHA